MMTQRPIRVVNIVARLNIGGPAIHVTLLTEKLGPPDYDSKLICGKIGADEGDMQYFADQHGVVPIFIPELRRNLNPIRDLITTWQLYRLLRQLKPDVVHTHTAKAGFVGRIAAKLAGVPVIVHTFHGHAFRGYFSASMAQLIIVLERFTARLSDTIITLTDSLRRELSDTYHITRKGRITVLPLGLDLSEFVNTPHKTGAFRKVWNIPPDVPLIGIVGRMVPIKNHALFLEAAIKVKAQLPEAHFLIVGDGDTRSPIEAQIDALGLRSAFTLTGWQKDLAQIYADMDVLVISSINEGMPISVIEALSAKCPVVATSVGGLPDLLGDGEFGKLVPLGDADALAAAIIDVLRQPPNGTDAQQAMLDRYGIERLIRDLDSLYRGLLAKKGRARG
jgi:glycosyltransferase involved in cell wall biosynthesis